MGLTALALEEGDLSAIVRDYLSTSLASCTGLLGIISQMIEFATFDAESQQADGAAMSFDERNFEIGALAEEVLDVIGAKARAVRIHRSCTLFSGISVSLQESQSSLAFRSRSHTPTRASFSPCPHAPPNRL